MINLLVDKFDDLFRKEGNNNGEPVYVYEYASDWSDAPHLEIYFDDYYQDMSPGYWDFFRRGQNSGDTYKSHQDAFRGYLEDSNYGVGDLDNSGMGFTDEINEIIEEQS